jgi:hypothetical protein
LRNGGIYDLSYENIKLWFAKNGTEEFVYIDEINDENKHDTYYCPMCNSNLIPKATKSVKVSSHFAHVDVSKCTPESMIHWWFKNKFIEPGDSFTVVLEKEAKYICKEVLVEQSYMVDERVYRPDVTIITECGNTIYFEMNYSNKKCVKDYLDIWIELKNIVVEIDLKSLMARGEIPKFKTLFYDGKCFNVKKNDVYYNTIGKYKEEKLTGVVSREIKERMKKLDWFWDDVQRYKSGITDIELICTLIDGIETEERKVIDLILMKPTCIKIMNDYIDHKSRIIYNKILKSLDDKYKDINYKISITEPKFSIYQRKQLTAEIRLLDVAENSVSSYDILKYTYHEIENQVEDDIGHIIKREKHSRDLNYARSNIHIKNVVRKIGQKYKDIDNKYSFHDRFGYDLYLSFHYDCKYKADICIIDNESIIYSDDEKFIEDYFENKISDYMRTVVPFVNKRHIEESIQNIDNYYSYISLLEKEKIDKKIGKGKWETEIRYLKYNIGVRFRYYAEDLLKITFYKKEVSSQYDRDLQYGIYLYQNRLYYSKKYIHFDSWYESKINYGTSYFYDSNKEAIEESVECVKSFNNDADWSLFKSLLLNIINKIIHDEFNGECIDCCNNFDVSVNEINFFVKNKLNLPRRCKSCRKNRKSNNKLGVSNHQ